jgi:zinc protease
VVPSYTTSKDGEAEALDLLSEVLGGGLRSRIYQELVVRQGIATAAGASYSGTALDATGFSLYGVPRGGATLEQVEAAVYAELAKVVKDGVSTDELDKAKTRYLRSMIFARDSQSGMANIYGATLATGGTVEDIAAWPDRIKAITPAQVQAAAAKYLDPDKAVTGYLLPSAETAQN